MTAEALKINDFGPSLASPRSNPDLTRIASRSHPDQIPGLAEFLERGGVVTEIPAEKADPKKFESVRIPKPAKTVKLSHYAPERVPKGEALATRLNMATTDHTNVGGGTRREDRITAEQIHAALANSGMREHEEKLVLYVLTGEQRYRSAAWALLMNKLADIIIASGGRSTKKRGTLTACADAALDYLVNPQQFKTYSDRQYASLLELENHSNWVRRWRGRFNELVQHGEDLIDRAHRIIGRSF